MHLPQDIILKHRTDLSKLSGLFDEIIGFKYLKGMHFNDSKKEFATKVDRHENIGKGFLGEDVFRMLMNDIRFDNMPLILETPEESLWEEEIKKLYSLVMKNKLLRVARNMICLKHTDELDCNHF